ncbi:hypothetical protein BO83DRAFT_247976 [Aspergillus eucalypticola CBS 122712]|uniref:Uncharacterized protein n=1 Tax=Aspergillus eucalypticola (strain CBS 122712 / IBT 29274) TaxID=1448314 RepID=A0A317VNE4_ASPEC|nr:uncharacterized protein BO83DRAFT_247976 [Aspergillus eucalypticola CBS 122712]PWY75863.1 hypothetical protein BO83DRAFT_247976 [Aspergillus eucalypticola CBS 122712]
MISPSNRFCTGLLGAHRLPSQSAAGHEEAKIPHLFALRTRVCSLGRAGSVPWQRSAGKLHYRHDIVEPSSAEGSKAQSGFLTRGLCRLASSTNTTISIENDILTARLHEPPTCLLYS